MSTKPLSHYVDSDHTLEGYAWNIIKNMETFTADDLHTLETEIKLHKRDKRVIGAILKTFETQGKIRNLGSVHSTRQKCHGRPIIKWEVIIK